MHVYSQQLPFLAEGFCNRNLLVYWGLVTGPQLSQMTSFKWFCF